jgi:hypothetical protein
MDMERWRTLERSINVDVLDYLARKSVVMLEGWYNRQSQYLRLVTDKLEDMDTAYGDMPDALRRSIREPFAMLRDKLYELENAIVYDLLFNRHRPAIDDAFKHAMNVLLASDQPRARNTENALQLVQFFIVRQHMPKWAVAGSRMQRLPSHMFMQDFAKHVGAMPAFSNPPPSVDDKKMLYMHGISDTLTTSSNWSVEQFPHLSRQMLLYRNWRDAREMSGGKSYDINGVMDIDDSYLIKDMKISGKLLVDGQLVPPARSLFDKRDALQEADRMLMLATTPGSAERSNGATTIREETLAFAKQLCEIRTDDNVRAYYDPRDIDALDEAVGPVVLALLQRYGTTPSHPLLARMRKVFQ